jgi:hypothetical protein
MAQVTVDAGICGCTTTIEAVSSDTGKVRISFDSDCPHVIKAKEELVSLDARAELFKKLHETVVYTVLSKYLPHTTCPLYSGFLKAVEVAAGMASPKNASIEISR